MLNQWFSDNISAYILLFYKRCPFTLRKGTFYNAKDIKSCAKRYAFANQ
ncbi:unknown [Prevotella sp. CAG:255]|nr:unknown [Prevotella sp. CAG:255]